MRQLGELNNILGNPKQGLSILASEVRLLIQNHEWASLWNALVFSDFQGDDFDDLVKLQHSIRFPKSDTNDQILSNLRSSTESPVN